MPLGRLGQPMGGLEAEATNEPHPVLILDVALQESPPF
jgi:hypothetical protein